MDWGVTQFGPGLGAQLPALLAVQKSSLGLVETIRTCTGPHSQNLQDWLNPVVSAILLIIPTLCNSIILKPIVRWLQNP